MEHFVTIPIKRKKETPKQTDIYDLLFGEVKEEVNGSNNYSTITVIGSKTPRQDTINRSIDAFMNLKGVIDRSYSGLSAFDEKFKATGDASHLYTSFQIPKRSGKMREITAPLDELKTIQTYILGSLKDENTLIPHHSAHAYIKEKSFITNATAHKNSKYFVKIDFKDFFPSITKEALVEVLSNIGFIGYANRQNPELVRQTLESLASLVSHNGVLPQGAPTSPILSNLFMTPFDYYLRKVIREMHIKGCIITRYADDITISFSKKVGNRQQTIDMFEGAVLEALKLSTLDRFMSINREKTTYSTNLGKTRVTGLVVNKENNVTIGYKQKQILKKDIARLVLQAKRGETPNYIEVTQIMGYWNFLHSVEPDYAKYIITTLEKKLKVTNLTKLIGYTSL